MTSEHKHLTDINLQDLCHRNVKRVHSVFTGGSADSSLIPQAGRKIQTSAGRNGLQINSQLIRVSKHSIVSHRSPAGKSGIFRCLESLSWPSSWRRPGDMVLSPGGFQDRPDQSWRLKVEKKTPPPELRGGPQAEGVTKRSEAESMLGDMVIPVGKNSAKIRSA